MKKSFVREDNVWAFLAAQRKSRIPRSQWFSEGEVNVYLRASQYHYNRETREFEWAAGVSNVNVNTHARQLGHFSRFLFRLEHEARILDYAHVRVEEVTNPFLARYLERSGYTVHGMADISPIYIKSLQE